MTLGTGREADSRQRAAVGAGKAIGIKRLGWGRKVGATDGWFCKEKCQVFRGLK